jgi:hypothetical protein
VRSFLKQTRGVLTFALLTINTIVWFVPVFVLALVKLVVPVKPVRRVITQWLMGLAENWISGNRLVLAGSGSRTWRADGIEDLERQGWYLVLANHQTWVDIVVLQVAFNRRIPLLKFFIKQQLVCVGSSVIHRHPSSTLSRARDSAKRNGRCATPLTRTCWFRVPAESP